MNAESVVIVMITCFITFVISTWILNGSLIDANNMIDCIYSQHTIEICEEILNYSKED